MERIIKYMYKVICVLCAAILIGTFGYSAIHSDLPLIHNIAAADVAPAH
ncbi:MAG: hypothetical protein ACI3XZ_07400 [Butyricicoccus sp.]